MTNNSNIVEDPYANVPIVNILTPEEKQELLRVQGSINKLNIFVETGTQNGDTVAALLLDFKKIISIELSDVLYENCVARFNNNSNVKLLHGDSSIMMGDILDNLTEPALFWLDAHYTEAPHAARSALGDSALHNELFTFFSRRKPHSGDILLLDDVRYFGLFNYPSVEEIHKIANGWMVEFIADDILIIK